MNMDCDNSVDRAFFELLHHEDEYTMYECKLSTSAHQTNLHRCATVTIHVKNMQAALPEFDADIFKSGFQCIHFVLYKKWQICFVIVLHTFPGHRCDEYFFLHFSAISKIISFPTLIVCYHNVKSLVCIERLIIFLTELSYIL